MDPGLATADLIEPPRRRAVCIDAESLALLSDDEFNAMQRVMYIENKRRYDIKSTARNIDTLHAFLAESSAFDCEAAMREIRARLNERKDALEGCNPIAWLNFDGISVLDGTVTWSDATIKYDHELHGNPYNYILEMMVSYGAGKSTATGHGDVFGPVKTYTISVIRDDDDRSSRMDEPYTQHKIAGVLINMAERRATLETFLPEASSGGILKAVRTFASVQLGASQFVVDGGVTLDQDQARAFWLTGE